MRELLKIADRLQKAHQLSDTAPANVSVADAPDASETEAAESAVLEAFLRDGVPAAESARELAAEISSHATRVYDLLEGHAETRVAHICHNPFFPYLTNILCFFRASRDARSRDEVAGR